MLTLKRIDRQITEAEKFRAFWGGFPFLTKSHPCFILHPGPAVSKTCIGTHGFVLMDRNIMTSCTKRTAHYLFFLQRFITTFFCETDSTPTFSWPRDPRAVGHLKMAQVVKNPENALQANSPRSEDNESNLMV